ncbi:MAG: sigma-54 interaction domain-containing protein [Bacillota bacterium]
MFYEEKWEKFINDSEISTDLDDVVLESWQRQKQKGIDPYKNELDLEILSDDDLQDKKKKLKKELKIIQKYMEYLFEFTADNNYLFSFVDEDEYILEVIGDLDLTNIFLNEYNYQTGVKWSEDKIGNNAGSLALQKKSPIKVVGAQHYCKKFHKLGCSAAPIENNNKVIGAIKIIGFSDSVNNHTLGMAFTSAKAIENELKMQALNDKISEQNQMKNAIVSSISDGLLYVNKDGIIKFMNKVGADILNVDHNTCIGKHVTEIVDFRPVILDVLETGEGYEDKEFYLRSKGELLHFIKTTKVLKDKNGDIRGVVDSFKEIKKIKKIVNNITGAQAKFSFEDIFGESLIMQNILSTAKMAAKTDSNVLIEGETGTGKELFAQAIHKESSRNEGPFVAINCAAFSPQLIESELFGYVEGSFTGARKGGRPGKFEMANGGTLFLDEIAEMPLTMQAKLLRVLQSNLIIRVGGNEYIPVDVRIISATNKDLLKEVNKNNFRQDLFYRLNVLDICIPPLRERKKDILLLANIFLKRISRRLNKNIFGFTEAAKKYLLEYNWPGNVRELENTIEKIINFCEKPMIDRLDFKKFHQVNQLNNNHKIVDYNKIMSLDEMKSEYIKNAVDKCDNNISEAAQMLGISRKTIYKWLD